jgi:hypothetical protein
VTVNGSGVPSEEDLNSNLCLDGLVAIQVDEMVWGYGVVAFRSGQRW